MSEKIDVFLLAAGEANRMYPLNQIMEKSLLPVDGKPVVRIIANKLIDVPEIEDIYICCLTKFRKQFEHEFRDLPVKIVPIRKPVGTFDTWFYSYIGQKVSKHCMVHYADCFTDINYSDFINGMSNAYGGFIAVTNKVKHDYSEVFFQVDNRVVKFNEKPRILNHTWSGIGIFDTDYLHSLYTFKKKQDFAFDIFPKMIKQELLYVYLYDGDWMDVGNLNSYRKICEKFNGENK